MKQDSPANTLPGLEPHSGNPIIPGYYFVLARSGQNQGLDEGKSSVKAITYNGKRTVLKF